MAQQFISVSASTTVDRPIDETRRQFLDPAAISEGGSGGRGSAAVEVIQSDDHTVLYSRSSRLLGLIELSNDVVLWESDTGDLVHEYVVGSGAGTTLIETFHALGEDETLVTATMVRPVRRRAAPFGPILRWWHRIGVQQRLDDRAVHS